VILACAVCGWVSWPRIVVHSAGDFSTSFRNAIGVSVAKSRAVGNLLPIFFHNFAVFMDYLDSQLV
jgi:hypothetical protein